MFLAARGISHPDYPCPDYYALFKAAKECNCTPWALLEQSRYWKDRALDILSGEDEALKMLKQLKW